MIADWLGASGLHEMVPDKSLGLYHLLPRPHNSFIYFHITLEIVATDRYRHS